MLKMVLEELLLLLLQDVMVAKPIKERSVYSLNAFI
jgi:hypothetical protein